MKKLLLAAALITVGSIGLTAQTAKTNAGSTPKAEKKEPVGTSGAKKGKASPIKAEATTTKTISSVNVKKVEPPLKTESSPNSQATPKNLKKDGTPVMRPNQNMPINKAVPTQK
jgi:hypothetical protein